MDPKGEERVRLEGYYTRDEFRAQLGAALGRVAFMQKKWADAEQRYGQVVEQSPETEAAPEALYWRDVSHYKATNDHTVLGKTAEALKQKYPDSIWATKATVWAH
jgi:TolA-binding protein